MIVADGRWTGEHGIGRYSREVLSRLTFSATLGTSRVQVASVVDPFWLAYKLRSMGASTFFSPGYNCAYPTRVRQILVLHDLIHLDVAAESSRAKRLYYERFVRPAIRHAEAVVTVSEFSRGRLAEWSGLNRESICLAPGGLSSEFARVAIGPRLHQRPYVLFVGNRKVHKRADLALAAATHLGDLDLLVVGNASWDLRQTNSDRERVHVVRSATDHDLARLYRDAACLLMPSEYEGFGLPALEAMSQGTEVVFSCDAVADVAGGCGTRVPLDLGAAELARVVVQVSERKGDVSASRCRERAALFNWNDTARTISGLLT